MASPKFKNFYQENMVVSSLMKENAFLLKMLNELSHHHTEHCKILEKFISPEAVRLEKSQQLLDRNSTTTLMSEQLSNKDGKLADMRREGEVSYFREIEQLMDSLVSLLSRCEHLANKAAEAKESNSDVPHSDVSETELQSQLKDALEKNKQWQDYDQQREAYVRAILARMLWLEEQLNKANQACSQQHNDNHSDEKKKISQVKEYYEGLLERANKEMELLRLQVDKQAQNECNGKETELNSKKVQQPSDDEDQWLKDEAKDLQDRLNKEKRKSATLELQTKILQSYLRNHHEEMQENIEALERKIEISSQDLQDERENCLYLRNQLLRLLKMLRKNKQKVECPNQSPCVTAYLPSRPSRNNPPPCADSKLLEDSFLECPSCRSEYPVSHYRDLLDHIENC